MATTVSAAEKMNRQYRFQRHIYDVTRTHYLFWRRRLISELDPPPGGTIVEIACGTGWNLLRAAETYPRARLYGLDISKEMLATATASAAKHGFDSRVKLAEGDATAFDLDQLFGVKSADRIFISYALSMIPGWPDAIERAVASLSPGGALHIVDFGRMEGMTSAGRWSLRRWLRHYNVTPRIALEATAREIAGRHGLDFKFEETRRGYTAYAILRRR
jgi:S-adenosylmethionine-diacylgycerolhomoserine-N-methlytransferase